MTVEVQQLQIPRLNLPLFLVTMRGTLVAKVFGDERAAAAVADVFRRPWAAACSKCPEKTIGYSTEAEAWAIDHEDDHDGHDVIVEEIMDDAARDAFYDRLEAGL